MYRAIWRALLAFSGDRDVADDALDEAFAQALARGEGIRDPLRWIWAGGLPRGGRRAQGQPEGGQARPGPDPREALPEPLLHVLAALGRLSPDQRLAVVLPLITGDGG
jgi:DNA-directed RNA polymerase specialized sigma24 family protein